HSPYQNLIAEPGPPAGRPAPLEVRLMTGLALGDALRRQRLLCGRGPRRPRLGREIDRDLAQIVLGQALGDRRHDGAVALAVPKVAQLLHEVARLLTPDGGNGLGIGGNAFVAMARRTELRLGLDLIRRMHRRDGDRKANPQSENRRKEACEKDAIPPSLSSQRARPRVVWRRG